jgi:GT2 family glycosyltransferase
MKTDLIETTPSAATQAQHLSTVPARVDVVVVAYNSRATLRSCVEPLTRLPWVRVTVVDNACPQDSAQVVEDLPIRIIYSSSNGGFAYGCNLGIANGEADCVLLLNPDAEIDGRSLEALADALRADPSLGGVGPRVVDTSGSVLFTQRRFPRLRSTYAQGLFIHRVAPQAAWSDDAVRDVAAYERRATPEWVSGCCVLLRREAITAVGGLDEGFFLYAEEIDLFKRLASAGWRVGFEPSAVARHEGQGSASPDATEHFRAASRVRYARKHHGPVVAALEGIGLALGAVTHAATWILHHPDRARGHLVAAGAALRAIGLGERVT